MCNLAQGCFYEYKCQGFPHLNFFLLLSGLVSDKIQVSQVFQITHDVYFQ